MSASPGLGVRHFRTRSGASIGFSTIGFGTAPLGNLYRPLSEKQASATLEAAWDVGIRYFDTAPLYGLGLPRHGERLPARQSRAVRCFPPRWVAC